MKTYKETVEWMFRQLPMYQRIGDVALKKDLSRTLLLAERLGNPHTMFKSIHIGGTNGKGSTSHMLAAVLQESGYKVGLYTSPHLKDFRERIKINGRLIGENSVIAFIETHKDFLVKNGLSFFEMTVGMAFDYFAREMVDIAVVEVGMGGRLDSTNIITPEVSVITNIGLDHTDHLGATLNEIAGEKAGIIKPKVPVVIGEKQPETTPVFQEMAKRTASRLVFAQDQIFKKFTMDLSGPYQKKNLQTLLATVEQLRGMGWKIPEEALVNGLNSVKLHTAFQGRWDVLQEKPKVICDTAHNKEGLELVLRQLKKEAYNHLHVVLGVVRDKDLGQILPLFPKKATYYFSTPDIPRGLDAGELAAKARDFKLEGRVFSSVSKAYEAALLEALDEDLIFIGGSNFTVAEII